METTDVRERRQNGQLGKRLPSLRHSKYGENWKQQAKAPEAKFHFDPQFSGLSHQISNASDYTSRSFRDTPDSDNIERELKYILPKWRGLETFLDFHKRISATPFENTKAFTPQHSKSIAHTIFHADPEMCGRDILLSIGMDTQQFDVMRSAKQQVRTRGRINLGDSNKTGSICPTWQFTIKDLLSTIDVNADGRDELEPDLPRENIKDSIDSYLNEHRHRLHKIYGDVDSNNLYASSLCITPRGSFNVLVFVPEMDAFVAYEFCTDPNRFFTPDGQFVGMDCEIEMEAKKVYFRKEQNYSDNQMNEAFRYSKLAIESFMKDKYADLDKSIHSKMERAMLHVGLNNFSVCKDGRIKALFSSVVSLDNMPFSDDRISNGLLRAIQQKITPEDVSRNHQMALSMLQQAEDPMNFLKPYGPFRAVSFITGSGDRAELQPLKLQKVA